MTETVRPTVSFVLATHNRCAVVTRTLHRLARCGLDSTDFEVIVVDNASSDGTAGALAEQVDLLIRLGQNAGSCAKAYGVDRASGRYIVFLDDDSCPRPGSVARMIEHFKEDPRLGAAGFAVHLPDGRQEGSALPGVFVGCGVGFRAEALRTVGGLDRTFFMQAEEYDLSFRLAAAGWSVEVLDDLHVDHLKTDQARQSGRTVYYDVRNNLRVIARYLPSPFSRIYTGEWLLRYAWLARRSDRMGSFARGALAGRWRGLLERHAYRSSRLDPPTLERFFRWEFVRERMARLAGSGVRSIVLADLGKNVFAFYRAARETGIVVRTIGDDRFSEPGRRYRDIPVTGLGEALDQHPDAVVVGNTSAVHAAQTLQRLAGLTSKPVHSWFDRPVRTAALRRPSQARRESVEADECYAAAPSG